MPVGDKNSDCVNIEDEWDEKWDEEWDEEWDEDEDMDDESDDESEVTYTSLEAALTEMTDRLAELDAGLDAMVESTDLLAEPVATVAIGAFTNPRVLEAAPFRTTKFRLLPAAKDFLGVSHHTVSFGELCAAIRRAILEEGAAVEAMWGTRDFLGILQCLSEIVE